MKAHKYANLFPLLDPDQFRALADDIKANGQREPIITWQGEIVDGRNRWAACELAGVAPVYQSRRFESEAEILAYVVSANIHRRHLSIDDKRGLLLRLAEEGKSTRQIAALTGTSKGGVYRALAGAPIGAPERVTGLDGKTYPASRPIQSARLPREEAGSVLFDEAEARLAERRRQAESPATFPAEPASAPSQSEQDSAPPHEEPAHEEATTTQEVAASVEAYFNKLEAQGVEGEALLDPIAASSALAAGATHEAAQASKPHITQATGEQEWYTPSHFVEAARKTMAVIDLDPASCEAANEVVKATRYYTKEQDGLSLPWAGRVWMNPPYDSKSVSAFIAKLVDCYQEGSVEEACVLVNNATETKWGQSLAEASSACCFPLGRIMFWHPTRDLETGGRPLQGQVIFYLGAHPARFIEQFATFGWCASIAHKEAL